MLEKRFYAVPPQLFTADGTTRGVITIAANACFLFKVKQKVYISATGLPNLYLEIKEIDSEDNIQVGPIAGTLNINNSPNINSQNTGISARTDISAYTVALGAAIFADEQKRPAIDNAEIVRATYQEEPASAVRSILVDDCGDTINENNPLPVNATITIPPVEVTIDAFTKVPPDNLIAVGTSDGTLTGTKRAIKIDNAGNLDVINMGALVPFEFDDIAITNSVIAGQTVVTLIQYYVGGPLGTLVATLTLTYDGSANLTNVQRS